MLANGAKLGHKKSGDSTFIDLPGLKEISGTDIEPERVESTCLTNKNRQYENGIGDVDGITYKSRYDNSRADCPYRVMRVARDAGEVLSFQETLIDGITTKFDGQVSMKRTGSRVNGVIESNLAISLQNNSTMMDPT